MIKLEAIYVLMGLLTGGIALVNARDDSNPRRWRNTLFWGVYAVLFLAGSYLGDLTNGILVLVMVATAAAGLGQGTRETATAAGRSASAARYGNRLFVPVLIVPLATFAGSVLLKDLTVGGLPLVDPKQVTQIALGIGTVLGLLAGLVMLRPTVSAPIVEARRLMDSVGWAAVLPQSLAALGAVFAAAGVGKVVSTLATTWLPLGSPLAAVVAYAVGMALFTMIMGNAFAAFPVMTAGIGLPLVVQQYGGDVVVVTAIGMLSGFCGTLMTPMAANFNIVPAALLELRDRYGVIRAQVPTALMLLVVNIVLMSVFAFR
ncbi:MAG: DUF979 domain-containing protein [Gemmatimonadaceae bacterium]|uniref:DUF979 domain-containing protein n=1 Tax=Gemmatimonas sp. TaxID=1962908 RepID=UPI001D70EB43|nr:DUF979 domain-containing protein [Gemmatimonas sp.]NCW43961.1 DUF979 domain-containing protein [Gemmatimonadaceae bacterium]